MTFNNLLLSTLIHTLPYIGLVLVTSVVLSFCIPPVLKSKYLKPPYFSKAEVLLLTSFPKIVFLGNHFTFMVAIPRFGKKRGLEAAWNDAPQAWRVVSHLYFWLGFVPLLVWVVGLVTFWIFTIWS